MMRDAGNMIFNRGTSRGLPNLDENEVRVYDGEREGDFIHILGAAVVKLACVA